ncbi:ribonuclease H2 subunit A [Punctularia strigosozonata HHB-11173 SS5]|uniref:Ribonuclease n=1 Tax=Punctularia strigosozonata (strain HHB-11173) TaxID=741275 RepID=R7S5Q6_PUNST|nr:ribonuclease H2 subunit A [Punctularia strigosozonata HHB-11173 SS5]EIN04881.1 ribonuclease H2 subunit A [Punctularia strigosozonata HHB-11173 SS5]
MPQMPSNAAGLHSSSEAKLVTESYTHHAPKPTAPGPYIMGVDEAGRGPVLGPLVYGVAYCTAEFRDSGLQELGFADSKTLTPEVRSQLLETLSSNPEKLSWSVRVLCPQALSAGMLRIPPINLNRQSEEATILLIREVLQKGIELTEVYVDALGPPEKYEKYLSSVFPGISITVRNKADSLFKIVGAASVAAKVTRDECLENWLFEEGGEPRPIPRTVHEAPEETPLVEHPSDADQSGAQKDVDMESTQDPWGSVLGSGYPGDPKTVAWMDCSLDPVFGYPSVARFSWSTIKNRLAQKAHEVKWMDEGQASLVKAFQSAQGRDKDRCAVTKDLSICSVGAL